MSERYGLALEVLAAVVVTVGFVIGTITLVLGFGAHGGDGPFPLWDEVLFGSWFSVLLGLTALGALVVVNTVLPLIRVEAGAITVASNRFRTRPRWHQVGRVTKLTCGVAVVLFGGPLSLLAATLAVDPAVIPEAVVDVRRAWAVASMLVLPLAGAGLLATVFVHALGRAVRVV